MLIQLKSHRLQWTWYRECRQHSRAALLRSDAALKIALFEFELGWNRVEVNTTEQKTRCLYSIVAFRSDPPYELKIIVFRLGLYWLRMVEIGLKQTLVYGLRILVTVCVKHRWSVGTVGLSLNMKCQSDLLLLKHQHY